MSMSKSTTKAKVLIIDDDEDISNLFKIYLEHDDFDVDAYTNPIDALYYFKKGKYDLILLDLKMPQIDGIAMFYALKNRDDKAIILRNLKDRINKLVLEKRITYG